MDLARYQIAGEKLSVWLLIFLGAIAAVFIGFMMGGNAIPVFVIFLTLTFSIVWIAGARERWWLLVPAAGTLGGFFYFGFKVYPQEIALLASVVPVALMLAFRAAPVRLHRPALPMLMYILGAYLVAHWFGSNIYNWSEGSAGYGNVGRAYFNAFWAIFFVILFWRYGSTRYIAAALLLCYLAAFARVIMGIVFYLNDAFAYIPVINYVLPGSTFSRSDDLRWSGLTLATLAICYFLIEKGVLKKTFHAIVFFASSVAMLFGSGRTTVVLVAVMPLFAAILYRKIIPVFATASVLLTIVFFVNASPIVLNPFPYRVQRSLSILLLNQDEAEFYGKTEGSNEWHEGLRKVAYSKWTQSWATVLFGTGIRPFDVTVGEAREGTTMTMEDMMYSSAKVGAYESGWWTVMAVTGLVGLVLYGSVLIYLLRKLLPILLRDRITDHTHAFAFMAVFGIVIWIGLGWTNGTFPSTEILFGFLALAGFQDRVRITRQENVSVPIAATAQPAGIR